MSTHAHEYGEFLRRAVIPDMRWQADQSGFPSSHSTNSVSIALYFAQWLLEERMAIEMPILVGGLTCGSRRTWLV